jgi:hypothetical protein
MTAASFGVGGHGDGSASVLHADAAHPDHILVPDAQFLFTAHFHRAGPDLVLTGADGHKLLIPGYFASEQHPALTAPNGASLSAHLVDLLAGSAAPNEYAQAGPLTPPEPIGRCEKVVGTVTVIRNGVAVALNVGDAVYKSDVVQTGANSSAGVAFPDGSALNLVANTRMALNEYSYDPNSNANSALFNLVEGGLSFVAGKVAHTGDMKIGTPIATMGIRGTAGWLYEEQVATITAQAGNVTLHFAAVFDSVTNTQSTYSLYAVDANGQMLHDPNGNLIKLADVSSLQNGLVTTLTGQGINALPQVNVAPPDITQQQFQNIVVPQVINMAIQAIQQYQNQQNQQNNPTNPQSNPTSGSGTPPPTPPTNDTTPPLQQINLNNGTTVTITTFGSTSPGSPSPPPLQQQQQQQPTQTTPTDTTGNPTWTGGTTGSFGVGTNWSRAPGPDDSPIIDTQTPSHPNVTQNTTIAGLTIGAGDSVQVQGDPTLTIQGSGQVVVEASGGAAGEIEASGGGAIVNISDLSVDDQGMILADSGGVITISSPLTVETGATVEASGSGSQVALSGGVTIAAGAEVEASGAGAGVVIGPGGVDDIGTLLADSGGSITISSQVTVETGATVEASGSGSEVFLTGAVDEINAGTILADNGGAVVLANVQVSNGPTGVIEATGSGSRVALAHANIVGGEIETADPTSAAGGEIEVSAGTGSNLNFFDGSSSAGAVTIDAYVNIDGGAALDLLGAIHNEGIINVDSDFEESGGAGDILVTGGSLGAKLEINGEVVLDGGGKIALDDFNDEIVGASGGGTLDNVDNTIFGSGTVGAIPSAANTLTFINEAQGVVDATGGTLILSLGANPIANTGLLEATKGGDLEIAGTVDNAGGAIAAHGSVYVAPPPSDIITIIDLPLQADVSLDDATIVGGTLVTDDPVSSDGGVIEILATTGANESVFDGSASAVTIDAYVQVDQGANLDLVGTIDDNGLIDLGVKAIPDNPVAPGNLLIDGAVTLEGTGMIVLDGEGSAITNANDTGDTLTIEGVTISGSGAIGEADSTLTVVNHGTIEAGIYADGVIQTAGQITIDAQDVKNESDGQIVSANGSTVSFGGASLENYGTIEAFNGGTVTFDVGSLSNEAGGTIEGIDFTDISIDDGLNNAGEVSAAGGSRFSISGDVTNTATIETLGGAITFTGGEVTNTDGATISGAVTFDGSDITNEAGATITLDGSLAEADVLIAELSNDTVHNAGTISIISDVPFDDTVIFNSGGTISLASESDLKLSDATIHDGLITDDGTIEVFHSSTIDDGAVIDGDDGQVMVDGSATLTLDNVTATDVTFADMASGAILAVDSDDTLTLGDSTIHGGVVNDDGTIEISGTVTIDHGAFLQGGGTIVVDSGATLILDNATLDSIDVINHGTVQIGAGDSATLADTDVDGGALSLATGSTLYLEGSGDTFDGVSVTNHGTIQVDGPVAQTTVTLEGGATISDGTLTIGSKGAVDIATGASGPGATLTDVTVDNAGQIEVHGTLDLAGGSISGGTLDLALGTASPQPIEIAVPGYYAIGPEVSANGQFVGFIASTSLPGQGNGDTNGLIELYNVAAGGQPLPISLLVPQAFLHEDEVFGNLPSLSDNGHLVVFEGKYPDDFGSTSEIFLYNSQAAPGKQITLVRSGAGQAVISGNGAVIAAEGNNTPDGGNGGTHILLMNNAGVVQTEISGDPNYSPSNNNGFNFGNVGSVYNPSLSDEGRYVAFWSTSSAIAIVNGPVFATGNTTGAAEVYVYDTQTHTLREASGTLGGQQGNGDSGTLSLNDDGSSWAPSLSGTGRFVVFQSTANNLVKGVGDADNDVSNIFLYDSRTKTITAVTDANGSTVTGDSIRPTISVDGKSITFSSDDSDLPGYNGGWQTYMVAVDPVSGTLSAPELLSTGFPGANNGQNNLASGVSDGGGVTAFGGAVLGFNTEQGQATISGGTITFSGLSISDFDTAGDTLTLTISVVHGTLVTTGSGGAGQASLTVTGTLAQIEAALQTGVTYTPGSPPSDSDTISLHVTDQTADATASFVAQFNPEANDPSQLFFNGSSPATTGQYDIFLSEQQTINVTADTTIDGGAQIKGGLIALSGGVTLTLDHITDSDTSFHDFAGKVAFTGSSTLDGTGIFGNTIAAGLPGGQVTIGNGVTLTLDDVVFKNIAVTVMSDGTTPIFQIDAGHTFMWAGNSSLGGTGSVIIEDNGHIIHDGTLDVELSQVTFEGSGIDTFNGGNSGTTPETMINDGVTLDGFGMFGSRLTIDNESGAFDADVFGQALVLHTGKTIINDGSFIADRGTLEVLDAVTGSGSATIEHGGRLEIGNTYGQTVTFDGTGTLQLDHAQQIDGAPGPHSFTGSISDFGPNDVVDLANVAFAEGEHAVWTQSSTADGGSGTLAIYDGNGTLDAVLNLNGIYSPAEFALTGDGSTANGGGPGTDVKFNYISFADGQINTNGGVTPVISNFGSTLQLTDGGGSEASSWFATDKVSVAAFTASFDYQATGDLFDVGAMADGFAFILQNSSAGPNALGGNGSSLGYGPDPDDSGGTVISPSAAVELNVYAGHTQGTNFEIDGVTGNYNPTGSVDFWDTGDAIQVVVSYDGNTLTETLTDLVNGNTYSTSYGGVDLAKILGSDSAYVGFSAATGGSVSTQTVSNFTFTAETPTGSGPSVDTWSDNDDNDSWSDGHNWSGGTPPLPGINQAASISSGAPTIDAGSSPVTLDQVNLANGGDLTVASGATLYLTDNTVISGGVLTIGDNDGGVGTVDVETGPAGSGATLDGLPSVNDYGALDVGDQSSSAALTLEDGTAVYGYGVGTMAIGDNATLDVEAGSSGPGSGAVLDGLAVSDNDTIEVATTTGEPATLTLQDGTTVSGNGTSTLIVGAAGELAIKLGDGSNGDGATLDNVTIANSHALQIETGAVLTSQDTVTIAGTGTVTNAGTLQALSGELSVVNTVNNTPGEVDAAGGFIDFFLGITGGNATISDGGKLEYGWSSNVATTFSGDGTLVLDHQNHSDGTYEVAHFSGAVHDFGSGDTIDLTDLTYVAGETVTWDQLATGADARGTLTVDSNGQLASITLDGTYSQSDFALSHDNGAGTAVVWVDTVADGATTELAGAVPDHVVFATNDGTLILDDPAQFTGAISGITGSGDVLDLKGFNFATTTATTGAGSFDDATGLTTLTVTDSSDHQTTTFDLAGNLSGSSWTVHDDGHGGANVFDPPATDQFNFPTNESTTPAPDLGTVYTVDSAPIEGSGVIVGGPGNDTFVFQPGIGAQTVENFKPLQDTIELDHFAQAQTIQELQSLITADAHGDAAINLGYNDSITLAGVTTAQLQQAIQSGHVLLH